MAVLKDKDNKKVSGKYTFRRGIHPPEHKGLTESLPVRRAVLKAGSVIVVPMLQHIGAMCKPTVEVKQEVTAGEVVGNSDAFVSAPVHSSVNGVVKEISPQPHPSGRKVLSVVITVGEEQPPEKDWRKLPGSLDLNKYNPETITKSIREAGVVGMGGAAFPTAVKLILNPKRPIHSVLVNGCECEPYLTSDHRLMAEAPETIVAGVQLAIKTCGAKRGIIAIEDNKPDAIDQLSRLIEKTDNLQLAVCRTKYPQGGERQLINAVLGKVVPTGGLPCDVRVVVINVATAAAITWACMESRPVTERIVTVTGKGVKEPGNLMVPVGMLLSELIEQCGGLTDTAEKVLLGGPMMGPATSNLNVPILKGTSGITVMTRDEVSRDEETACIRCSRCVDYCPLGLVPTQIAHAVKARNLDTALKYDLLACIECGSCAYVCPARIPLLQYLRAGKAMARIAEENEKRRQTEAGSKKSCEL